ncbi:TraK family protein [Massilia soli]|uniref:TraK family protein n=1 Tax=Massilia soli TaxID=2792854 RepID=A0ABS7SK25_9BURK|nr:TraK family protein [Massilia soli]MBZ2206557.1 TraK family protein [Massilia soli]
MAKSYTEQLAEWVKRRPAPTRRDKNLVAFLAVRDDVRQALDEGYAVKTVWAHMHDSKRIEFGYDTFLNYVNRYLRSVDQPVLATSQAANVPTFRKAHLRNAADKPVPSKPIPHQRAAPAASEPAGFTFNPAPNIKELM